MDIHYLRILEVNKESKVQGQVVWISVVSLFQMVW